MNIKNIFSYRITLFACFLAFVVIVLGAYTRLTDAGLGCPDWPGCYGQLTVPQSESALTAAQKAYPDQVVQASKAWAEMVHRYVAGVLGLLIFTLFVIAIRKYKTTKHPIFVPLILVGLVIFQAALGAWTVTMKLLPIVVMGHLLGGLTILSLLWWLHLKLSPKVENISIQQKFKLYKPWVTIGIIIIALQLALGGWTSANYAALSCPDFPYCQGSIWPGMDFKSAFNLFNPIGPNYEGGLLDNSARVTIHMMHRVGALVTTVFIGLLGVRFIFAKGNKSLQITGVIMTVILSLQVLLGILNVVASLPLSIAILHNAFAALLLLSLITITYLLQTNKKESVRV